MRIAALASLVGLSAGTVGDCRLGELGALLGALGWDRTEASSQL